MATGYWISSPQTTQSSVTSSGKPKRRRRSILMISLMVGVVYVGSIQTLLIYSHKDDDDGELGSGSGSE